MTALRRPDLRYVIPGWGENRWSDLLAALLMTDPEPMERMIGAEFDEVRREAVVTGGSGRSGDRLDLLLSHHGRPVAAIEVKVLSDLGFDQLVRYSAAYPEARHRYVLHLDALPVNPSGAPGWSTLTWEGLLSTYGCSEHPWVAATAAAWLGQLGTLVPDVEATTVWNDVPDEAQHFELALRARIAWLAHHLDAMTLERDIVQSSGGGLWVLRFWATTDVPHLRVQVEVQEGLSSYAWKRDPGRSYHDRLKGPAPVVALRLSDVDTSEDFDWDLLKRVFDEHVLDEDGEARPGWPWQTTAANPRNAKDRAAWLAMIESGGPKWLGKGFGMAVATRHYRECLFGARMQFASDLTLAEVRDRLLELEPLVRAMAETVNASVRPASDARVQ